jgi:hypothetical protein
MAPVEVASKSAAPESRLLATPGTDHTRSTMLAIRTSPLGNRKIFLKVNSLLPSPNNL